jgi:hypothetical protein
VVIADPPLGVVWLRRSTQQAPFYHKVTSFG